MKKVYTSISFLLFVFSSYSVYSQSGLSQGILYQQAGVTIELFFKVGKKPCDPGAKKNQYYIKITNADNIKLLPSFLNWKMQMINCDGNNIEKNIVVNLGENSKEGINKSIDWEFESSEVTRPFYDVSNTPFASEAKDKVISRAASTKADRIVGNFILMTGDSTTLNVEGGALKAGASWVWYVDDCGARGSKIGNGASITVKPYKTSTYFVRGEGKFNTTDCVSQIVVVDNNSKAPEAILGRNYICKSDVSNLQLTVVGGKLGYQANWVWYESNCGSTPVGTGETIFIPAKKNATYFVRAEGKTISPTLCISHAVQYVDPSNPPQKIKAKEVICEGDELTLEAIGGKLSPGATLAWTFQGLDEVSKDSVGEGAVISVYPERSGRYFVSTKSVCDDNRGTSIAITVREKSADPTYITSIKGKGTRQTFTVNGGSLGTKAKWVWYKDECGENKLETGPEFTKKIKKNQLLFVRAEGLCNTSNCTSILASYSKPKGKKGFGFINAGLVANSAENLKNGMITIGSRSLYLRAKVNFDIISGENTNFLYETNNSGIVNYPQNSGTTYEFNGQSYRKRSAYTAGLMLGGNKLRFYIGGGYGTSDLIWGVTINNNNSNFQSESWAKNIEQSAAGPEAEAGIFIKLKRFNLMGGVSGIYSIETDAQYFDGHVGIGFSF